MMDAEAAPPGFSGRKLEERAYILLPHPADEADDALEERFVAPGNLIAAKAALYLAMRQFAKLGRSLVLSLEHAA